MRKVVFELGLQGPFDQRARELLEHTSVAEQILLCIHARVAWAELTAQILGHPLAQCTLVRSVLCFALL